VTHDPRPIAALAVALLTLTTAGGVVLGHAGDHSPGTAASDRPAPTARTAPGSPRMSNNGRPERGADVARPYPSACTYERLPSRTIAPAEAEPPKRQLAAGAVVQVTGVLTAEGWVPPPGQTCPPEP